MKILAIDTATEACSVALKMPQKNISRFEICPQQHSQRLLPMVDEVLKEAEVTLGDIDLLAFGRGPGSFTGVRIATGMIQGLALGTGLKVAGVSTLEAMACEVAEKISQQAQGTQYIAVASDARMDEVYFAVFAINDNGLALCVEEQVCAPDVVIGHLEALNVNAANMVVAGTGWAAYEPLSTWLEAQNVGLPGSVTLPNAKYMLSLAARVFDDKKAVDAVDVEPVYLRDKVTWKKLPGRE
ncbi:tRNA (adenosine(37)-N6)-threonylcarbamoyltransferase complex dimerization subunit type 1 TsaB [Alteromonas sp. D210916BOD_24]|uniref:tRNA (adenosine(37)-N6)-threonylcarbamoyltransferase complex dimerization subunit type 1 TsaB n=1 Tax=Alteromonas sp. D210916BOD_24 TaxID=3157618 RepID=UPI00399D530F